MPESDWEEALRRLARGLEDRDAQHLAVRLGHAINAHWRRRKLTAAGPRYLNVRTGNLRSSTTVQPHASRHAVVGTNVVYAPVHEFGSRDGRNRARHHLEHSIRDSNRTQKAAMDLWLRQRMRG